MTRVTVSLNRSERAALQQLSEQQRREPRAQAAWIIRHYLEALGLLPISFATNGREKTNES